MKPKTVMIVEDEDVVRDVVVALLKSSQIKFEKIIIREKIETAFEAIRMAFFTHEKIDLLITDLRLGNGIGFDVVQEAKEKFPEIKIIMMSGNASSEDGKLAVMMGVNDFFTKPLNFQSFLNRITELIG